MQLELRLPIFETRDWSRLNNVVMVFDKVYRWYWLDHLVLWIFALESELKYEEDKQEVERSCWFPCILTKDIWM